MALDIKLGLKLSQQLVMTPQLQQAIKLLQLNRMELAEVITAELMENPILEESPESAEGEAAGSQELEDHVENSANPESEQQRDEDSFIKPTPKEEQLVTGNDDFNWENYVEDFNSNSSSAPSMKEVNDELPSFENVLTKSTSLDDPLIWQLSMIAMNESEQKLSELIVGNLTDDGYLNSPREDLAKEAEIELEDAEEILKMVHNLDPVGVGSRSLQECLLIQARFMKPRQPLVEQLIENHLPDLERKNYTAVPTARGVPVEKMLHAIRLIVALEQTP